MGLELFSHSKLEVSEKCTCIALSAQKKTWDKNHSTIWWQKNEFLIFSWPELLSTKVKHKQFWSYCHSAVKLQISKNFIKDRKFQKNGILLPKLFWPTVRKNCPSDREKLLKFEAEGREFAKFLRSLKLKRFKKQ